MKMNFTKFFAAMAIGVVGTSVANADTVSQEYKIDFTTMEIGHRLNSYWGGANSFMAVVANPFEGEEGNLLYVNGPNGGSAIPDSTVVWSTYPRIENLQLPAGFNFSNIVMIEINYFPTQVSNVQFGIQLQQTTNPLLCGEDAVINEWNVAVFDPSDFVKMDTEEPYTSNSSSLNFCLGMNGSSFFYVKDITFYLEKESTQRELDEDNLDKATAACVEVNFDNWDTSFNADGEFVSSTHLGSNGYGTNRQDMIIDKGPEGYNNNCAHVVYGGWTNMFLADVIQIPEGYTFDDLRLVEYDLYETEETGVNCTNGETFPGKNGIPVLKLKNYYNWGAYEPIGGGASAITGTTVAGKWNHVEFRPSTFTWAARDFEQDVLDENGEPVKDGENNVKEQIHWDADQTMEEFNKVTSFAMSIGFMPCQNQCYIDNVKCWFQKSGAQQGTVGIDVIAAPAQDWVVYNLQGIRVMKATCEADLNTLPAGLYIVNGKKYLVK